MSKYFSILLLSGSLIGFGHASGMSPQEWDKTYRLASTHCPHVLAASLAAFDQETTRLLRSGLQEAFRTGGLNAILDKEWQEIGAPRYQGWTTKEGRSVVLLAAEVKEKIANLDARLNIEVTSSASSEGHYQVHLSRDIGEGNERSKFLLIRTFLYNVSVSSSGAQ